VTQNRLYNQLDMILSRVYRLLKVISATAGKSI